MVESDPWVLSEVHQEHVRHVADGNYGYMIDVSAATLFRDEFTCRVTNIAERFIPMHYAIGLQNNSAYQAIFDRQYVPNIQKKKYNNN